MSAALLERPTRDLSLTVNGRRVTVRSEPRTHLADMLREDLDLTGTHLGCEHGVCGACTVLIDGEPARACLAFAVGCEGAAVTTIEGLDEDEVTAALRAAFTREHALQCGYCTPGMLVTARDLVLRLPEADERRVRLGLSGNLCRCTGYVGIVRAIMSVLAERRSRGIAPAIATRALGPVGARPGTATASGVAPARPGGGGPASAGPVPAVDLPREIVPAHSFDQSFTIAFPPHAVFALFGRLDEVAACLPGAVITSHPALDRVEGGIRVKLGPIAAEFRGTARIERDDERRSGRILGVGQDRGGRSTTEGVISYRVAPGETEDTSRVDLTVGYTLKGALAQFGRPGLVRDLATRITVEFARNLEARLSGNTPTSLTDTLDTASLFTSLVRGWLGAALRALKTRIGRGWPTP